MKKLKITIPQQMWAFSSHTVHRKCLWCLWMSCHSSTLCTLILEWQSIWYMVTNFNLRIMSHFKNYILNSNTTVCIVQYCIVCHWLHFICIFWNNSLVSCWNFNFVWFLVGYSFSYIPQNHWIDLMWCIFYWNPLDTY